MTGRRFGPVEAESWGLVQQVVEPDELVPTAMALAHELEEERAKRQQVERRSREVLKSVLSRVDSALGTLETAPSSVDASEEPALVEVRRKGADRAADIGRDD